MDKYEKILDDFQEDNLKQMQTEENSMKETELQNANSYEKKADIILQDKVSKLRFNLFLTVVGVVIIGNILINPPIIAHSNGHFAFIIHPIETIKQCYFSWGIQQNSFIYSFDGLRHYLGSIPYIYSKYGFTKATFAFFTQLSPVWAFIPAKLLISGISNLIQDIVYSEKEELVKYLIKQDKKEAKNE